MADAAPDNPESLLVSDIRHGKPDAWRRLIDEYEGRLLAFVRSRLGVGKASSGEDVVQETFIGFLNSLPNYDARRPLERASRRPAMWRP